MLAAFAGAAALVFSLAAHADDVVSKASFKKNTPSETTAQNVTLEFSAATVKRYLSGTGPISAVWANTGEDKVTKDELRARKGTVAANSAWTGTQVTLFGAKNEVVAFNLILEAATTSATGVTVEFDTLTGPGGATIQSTPVGKNGVFNWVGRDIELFLVQYLQIKGVSQLSYGTYD